MSHSSHAETLKSLEPVKTPKDLINAMHESSAMNLPLPEPPSP